MSTQREMARMVVDLYSEQTICEQLEIDSQTLLEYQRLGLVRTRQVGYRVGYGPAEVRRIWSIVSLQRDLGLDLDAVEVVLQMRDQMVALQQQICDLLELIRDQHPEAVGARRDEGSGTRPDHSPEGSGWPEMTGE